MSTLISIGSNETRHSDVVEVYDEIANTWTRLPDIPVPRRSYMVEIVDGKIMLIGGSLISHNHNVPENTVEALDPATGTITEVAPLQVARQFGGTVVIGEGSSSLLYVFGGWGAATSLDSVERWSPVTNTWTFVEKLPYPNTGCRTAVVNGVIYLVGGMNLGSYVDDVFAYNATNNVWEKRSPLLHKNGYVGITTHKNFIYIVGGYMATYVPINEVQRYDVTNDYWTLLARVTEVGEVGLTVFNDKVIVAGGNYSGLLEPDTVEEYDEETNTWKKLSPLNVARAASHLITLPATMSKVKFDWKFISPY